MKCPNCNTELDMTELIELNARQQQTLEAVREIQRNDKRGTATTKAVAGHIAYSERWALKWLQELEQLGLIKRPRGIKAGWKAVQKEHVVLQLHLPVILSIAA